MSGATNLASLQRPAELPQQKHQKYQAEAKTHDEGNCFLLSAQCFDEHGNAQVFVVTVVAETGT